MTARAKFASVVLDADSTLCGLEGIDWLAGLREPAVATQIAELTNRAMNGEIALDAVYGARLRMIRPTRAEVSALADAYRRALARGASDAIRALRDAGVVVRVVSSGIRQALEPVVAMVGLQPEDLHAVALDFGDDGVYRGYDTASLLTRANGKATLMESLGLPRPILAVGDGSTDLAMRVATDCFAAFTGFVRREPVVQSADVELGSFDDLQRAVLS